MYQKGVFMNEIFICNWGQSEFSDLKHLNNFIDYLFSKSKLHKQNETTKYNFYKRKVEDKFKTGFIENNEKIYDKFRHTCNLESFNKFKNDLFYIYFMIIVDNNLITNLMLLDNNSISLNITDEAFTIIVNDYFNGEEHKLFNKINEFINYINTNSFKIINYYDLIKEHNLDNIYLIKIIETEIHKKLQEKYYDKNVIFQISHNDQYDKPYHIHRLIHDKG